MKWLWDTNVVSEIGRGRPDRGVLAWMERQPAVDSVISIVTLAELRAGAAIVQDELRRTRLTQWIDATVAELFSSRTLPLTLPILTIWLGFGRRLAARRTSREAADLLIAATARVHDLILVTRNVRDFAGTGVTVYNPWSNQTETMDAL